MFYNWFKFPFFTFYNAAEIKKKMFKNRRLTCIKRRINDFFSLISCFSIVLLCSLSTARVNALLATIKTLTCEWCNRTLNSRPRRKCRFILVTLRDFSLLPVGYSKLLARSRKKNFFFDTFISDFFHVLSCDYVNVFFFLLLLLLHSHKLIYYPHKSCETYENKIDDSDL